jgi:hypothetical protein
MNEELRPTMQTKEPYTKRTKSSNEKAWIFAERYHITQ